jgi:hypothetical protein
MINLVFTIWENKSRSLASKKNSPSQVQIDVPGTFAINIVFTIWENRRRSLPS